MPGSPTFLPGCFACPILKTFGPLIFGAISRSPPKFPSPPAPLLQQAKRRAIVMLNYDFGDGNSPIRIILNSIKSDGFNMMTQVADSEAVHYPNLKPEWFEQNVLPFLDKSALGAPEAHVVTATAPPKVAPVPTTSPPPRPPPRARREIRRPSACSGWPSCTCRTASPICAAEA